MSCSTAEQILVGLFDGAALGKYNLRYMHTHTLAVTGHSDQDTKRTNHHEVRLVSSEQERRDDVSKAARFP